MISLFILAFLASTSIVSAHLEAMPRCIQPEVAIVHRGLRLLDLSVSDPGSVLKRSSGMPDLLLPSDGLPTRIMLQPNEQIRVHHENGEQTPWMNPLDTVAASPEAEETPAWALGAVWYNIFPERFDNAEPRNDQAWPHGTPLAWGEDWFTVTADEFEASANRSIADPLRYGDAPQRQRPLLNDVVFERRYGGDLQGVRRRLDHITSLGATALWLCPVFESDSLHKYDATDHRHIDPHLAWPGTPDTQESTFSVDINEWKWTPADREFVDRLLPEAHAKGLRVILDGVWNHVGTYHPAFQDSLNRGTASPYFDWFDLYLDETSRVAGWHAWDGRNGRLPAFLQVGSDLAPGPKKYVFDVTRRWMDPDGDGDPSDGIDGWRLDVANEIGLDFWADWRRFVRSIQPEAVLIGELWFNGRDYFGGNAFDAQMNYPVAFVLLPWLGGIRNPALADDLLDALDQHPATMLAQMNLLASHDTARLVSMLANPELGYDQNAGLGALGFERSRPGPEIYDRLELAYAVLAVLPGAPMVFAGDELGAWGGDDPENRKPLQWPDLTADESLVSLAHETTSRLAHWLRLRNDDDIGSLLRFGGCRIFTEHGILVIERDLNGRRIRLYANASNNEIQCSVGPLHPRSARLFAESKLDVWVEFTPRSENP